jgi:plastocyanin
MAKLQSGTRVYGNTTIDTFITVGANASITGTTNATSNSTGTLIVAGGVGIKGNVFTGSIYITGTSNNITFVDGTTLSTSPTASINAAFIQANSANTLAANSYIQANASFIQANSANTLAANSYIQANASFIQANSANTLAANSYIQANASFIQANSANTLAANSYIQANSANVLAANSYIQANLANAMAYAAFAKANTGGSGSSSGYLANSIIYANTNGYLSNVSSLQFFSSNNTLVTTNITLSSGSGGIITFSDGTTQATAASGASTDAFARTQSNSAFLQANSANTLAANSYIQANAAFIQANSANTLAANSYIQANASFIQANSANTLAANSYIQANASFIQANSANTLAANSYIQANASFIQANSANTLAANSYIQANASFIQANSANTLAANSYIQANASFIQANSANTLAANSYIQANASFIQANSANTLAANSYIQANSANTLAANSYIQANASFIQANSANTLAANSYIQANASFIQANSANTLAANSYIQANASFTQANSNYTSAVTKLLITTPGMYYSVDQYSGNNPTIYIRAGETIAFNLNVSGHPFMVRVSSGGSNYNTGLTHVDADGTLSIGASAQGKITGTLYWKVPYDIVGSTYVYQCSVHSGMVGNIVIDQPTVIAFNQANAAFLQANTANNLAQASFNQANGAYNQANTANNLAQASFNQANGAYNQANTANNLAQSAYNQANNDVTNITTSAGTYGNSTYVPIVTVAANGRIIAVTNTAITVSGGGGVSASGYLSNSIIFANTTGYLSNTSGLQFFSSNNTLVTTNITLSSGSGGLITFQDGTTQATAASGAATDAFARTQANASFIQANTANTLAANSYIQANAAFIMANAAFAKANSGGSGGGGSGSLSINRDTFTASGSSAVFNLSSSVSSSNNIIVNLNGVPQLNSSYTISGTTLTLSETPVNGTSIDVITFLSGTTGGGISASGYLANSIMYANTNGYLSNVANLQFFEANNTIVTTNIKLSFGSGGVITFADGTTQSTAGGSTTLPLILNDISSQFTGLNSVFNLLVDQTNITNSDVVDSKNMEVIINGLRLAPYIKQNTYPWLTPYDSFMGFRVVSDANTANLIIYNSPVPGDQALLTIINKATNVQTRKYPYSATTIALGD